VRIIGVAVLVMGIAVCGRVKESNAPRPDAPLPDSAFRVKWDRVVVPPVVEGNAVFPVDVTFTNIGDKAWPDAATADPRKNGAWAVRVAYRWLGADGKILSKYGDRVDLPKPVPPGGTQAVRISVKSPPNPGQYRLQVDLLQELVSWFEARGAATSIQPVTVR
jgi:hypothetical protein